MIPERERTATCGEPPRNGAEPERLIGCPTMSSDRHTRRSAMAIAGATVGAAGAVTAAGCSGEPQARPERLLKLDDVKVGKPALVQRPGGRTLPSREQEQLIVVRLDEQTVQAYSNLCTHAECLVKPKGETLHCFCHEADYDPATGRVLAGPPPKPLAKVDVHVADGWVMTGLRDADR